MGSTAMAISMRFNFHRNPSLPVSNATIPWSVQSHVFVNGITISMKSFGAHVPQPSPFRRANLKPFARVFSISPGLEDVGVSSSPESEVSESTSDSEAGRIKMRINVSGDKTQVIFDNVFSKLVDAAQPIPGFRRVKGGKTPNIPKDVLLRILGPSKVNKEAIKKIINSTMSECVANEGLEVTKDLKIEESYEELEAAFEPGKEFSFNAIVQLRKTDTSKRSV